MKKKTKLLAAMTAIVMAFAGIVVLTNDNESNAVTSTSYDSVEAFLSAFDDDTTMELENNTTVTFEGELDLTGKTINCKDYTITFSGSSNAKIIGGTFTKTGESSKPGIAINLSGVEEISGSVITLTKSTEGNMPFALDLSDNSATTITNVDFNADEVFCAVHTNSNDYTVKYDGNADASLGNGYLMVKETHTATLVGIQDAVISITACGGPGSGGFPQFNTGNVILENSTIAKTIIGWDTSSIGVNKTYNAVPSVVNVTETINLGKISAANGNAENVQPTIDVKEGADLTGYGGEGITTLNIGEGASFTVPTGETYEGPAITGTGDLIANGTVTSTVDGGITVEKKGIGLGNDLIAIHEDILSIGGEAFLIDNLVIPADKTLRLVSGSSLNMNGRSITVYGTLEVEYGATVTSTGKETETISLDRDGTIVNEGTIGYGKNAVTINALNDPNASYAGQGSISMKNVSGVSFFVVNSGKADTKPIYILDITGNINAETFDGADSEITVNEVRISGEMNIESSVNMIISGTEKTFLNRNSVLTINGSITTNDKLLMKLGTTVEINGTVTDKILAETGDYASDATPVFKNTEISLDVTPDFNLSGLIVTVGETRYNDVANDKVMISQRAYLGGTVTYVYTGNGDVTAPTKADITITTENGANAYVDKDVILSLGEKVKMSGKVTVLGTVQYNDDKAVTGYIGTQYRVDSTNANGTKSTVYFIKPFEVAFNSIADAYQNNVNISENVKIDFDMDILAKYKITLVTGSVIISEDATVTVRSQGTMCQISDVQGVLYKYNGSTCPTPTTFVVTKKTTDYTMWSGLVPAITNAQPGDVIDITKSGETKENMTIPEGVTVNIAEGAELEFKKDLTVDDGAKLVNKGTITMEGKKSQINVNGELESEGIVQFTAELVQGEKDIRAINSTGTTTLADSVFQANKNKINGAVFKNNDGDNVITTVSDAIKGVASTDAVTKTVEILGTVSDNGSVVVEDNTTLNITGNATLGTITIDDGKVFIDEDGTLTATIVGAYGVDGSTSEATATVNKASGLTFTNSSAPNNKGETVWSNTVSGNGNTGKDAVTTFESGEFILTAPAGGSMEYTLTSVDGKFIVSENANLVIASGVDVVLNDDIITILGTLTVKGGIEFAVTDDNNASVSVIIPGTIDVAKGGELTVKEILDITGTLNVDEEGTVTVDGILAVGDKPKSLGAVGAVVGKIDLGTDGLVKAYAGADLSAAELPENAVSTEYQINGALYMTAYANPNSSNKIMDVANEDKIDLAGLKTPTDGIVWKSGNTAVVVGDSIGKYDVVVTEFKVDSVNGKISVGNGITLYIDGLTIDNWKNNDGYYLTMGSHTVSWDVDSGYTADNVKVTFNGADVSKGASITVGSDMTEFVIAASGATPASGSSSGSSGSSSSDDGMSITDYLLIVLVVLIVIMAVLVAIRMMRS